LSAKRFEFASPPYTAAVGDKSRAIAFGASVHVARFGVIMLTLAVAPIFGVSGWYLGITANVACVIFAAVLVTVRGLWRTSGLFTAWRGPVAVVLLLPLLAEALAWAIPFGLVETPPGFGLWGVTLLLVGINEELTSRVVVLERMRASFTPVVAVSITAALFGLQHLSAFATTSRTAEDILLNVLVSGCTGFALAAFQFRFRWVWPLILIHAGADFTAILTARPLSDLVIAGTVVLFLAFGFGILRSMRKTVVERPAEAASAH